MREIGTDAFYGCKNLKQITFADGSRLERIGTGCFSRTRIEELTLPGTLVEVGEKAFKICSNLRRIRLEGEREVDLTRSDLPDSVQVIFLSVTLPGGVRL